MRNLDRLLTSGMVVIAAHLLFGLGFAVSLEFAMKALWDWRLRVAWVQGQYVRVGESRLRPEEPIPAILADGSLDPAYAGPILELPEFSYTWWAFPDGSTMAAQTRRRIQAAYLQGVYQPRQSTEYWAWNVEKGIQRFDLSGEFKGTLTDDGFVMNADAKSSFQEALLMFPPQHMLAMLNQQSGILLYATSSGLYRADLDMRTLELLTPLSAESVALYSGSMRDFYAGVPRIYFVTPSSVHWCDTARNGAYRSFELPQTMRGFPFYEVAPGIDGRIIVRAHVEKYLKPGLMRLRTIVFEADGEVVNRYEYEIDGGNSAGLYAELGEETGDALGVTIPGKFVQAAMPPAWRLPLDPAEAFISPEDYAFRRGWLKRIGGLWTALALSAIAAALVGRQAHRRGAGWAATIAWAAAVVALGIPMALAAYFIIRPARRETCAGCGARQAVSRAACRRCGAAIPGPAKLGIEIT